MISKILALNVSSPKKYEWKGKDILSSMQKDKVDRLIIHQDRIENDVFAEPEHHGTKHCIVYIMSIKTGDQFFEKLNLGPYAAGAVGENILTDEFDEENIHVGDTFQIGSAQIQATFPRRPCVKLNFKFQNALAQKAMLEIGRSGVYFQVLKPGIVSKDDQIKLIHRSENPFSIHEAYMIFTSQRPATLADYQKLSANDALPAQYLKKLKEMLNIKNT